MEENMSEHREQERTVEAAWIFDVDGVITNPQEKKVTEPQILDHIAKRLESGEPVAFNTGRSLSWLVDRVINPLLEGIQDKNVLKNLFAVGEKGGTWLTFDSNGEMKQHKDESISIPQSLQERVKNLIETEYSDSMFYDASKRTMISTEMQDGYDVEEYRELQHTLNEKLNTLIEQENLGQQLKVDPTTIATDIENRHVGKDFAVKKIIEWIKSKGIHPQRYITFGDSFRSDVPMAQEIHSQGLPIEFVYVGREDIQTSNYPFPIKRTQTHFEKGTLEFLKTL